VISDWVHELSGTARRDVRNIVAHVFNSGTAYRNIEDRKAFAVEKSSMNNRRFSVGAFWGLLEMELAPQVEELGFAVACFEEQIERMQVENRVVRGSVVRDATSAETKECSQGTLSARQLRIG
jgi:hypothetical protein